MVLSLAFLGFCGSHASALLRCLGQPTHENLALKWYRVALFSHCVAHDPSRSSEITGIVRAAKPRSQKQLWDIYPTFLFDML